MPLESARSDNLNQPNITNSGKQTIIAVKIASDIVRLSKSNINNVSALKEKAAIRARNTQMPAQ